MLRFIVARLAVLIPTFLGVTIVAFAFIRLLPGDPIRAPGRRARHHTRALARSCMAPARLRPAALASSTRIYLGGSPHGDLGTSICTTKPVLAEFLTLFPATRRAVDLRDHPRRPDRRAGRGHRRGQARLGLRPGADGDRRWSAIRCRSSGGACCSSSSSPASLGWTPVSGPDRRCIYFFKPVTGFMLIDSLLSGQTGAFQSALSPSDPADDRARHDSARGDRAADPLGDARGAQRGLCAHGARQGAAAVAGGRPACASQRADPGGHHDRAPGRRADGRRDPDRDHLLLAGHRQVDGRFDLPPRLPSRSRAGCC